MKKQIILILIAILPEIIFSQPVVTWHSYFGGSYIDNVYCLQQTFDSGYIACGETNSTDGDVVGLHGGVDAWVVKMDKAGVLQWQICLGGLKEDKAYSVQQTKDSGYIVFGYTEGDSIMEGFHGCWDMFAVKLSSSGNIIWQKCYGGTSNDLGISVDKTFDGGYIMCGITNSNDGDVSGIHTSPDYLSDYWVVKTNASGDIEWQKCLGGIKSDYSYSIQQTKDSGYIVGGTAGSSDGDVIGYHNGTSMDCWLVKLNKTGDIQWQKCYGGTGDDRIESVKQTTDGGYIFAGYTISNDGDVSGNHGGEDYWVVKVSDTGAIKWQKCLGGTDDDEAKSVYQTNDGGYIVSGQVTSSDGDVTGFQGTWDGWLVRLDSLGKITWEKCIEHTRASLANAVMQTYDGGYVTAGCSTADSTDTMGFHGYMDFLVTKFESDVSINHVTFDNHVTIYPNPTFREITIETPLTSIIEIYNLEGQCIKTLPKAQPTTTIDVSWLPAGIYFIKATSEKGTEVRKFVKE